MKAKILGLVAVGLLAGPMAAQAVTVSSYDISLSQLSGFGGWSHTYSGTITGNVYSGGSGTLNDGIIPTGESNNHLFRLADDSVITLHLSGPTLVTQLDLLGGVLPDNFIPGTLTGATITIGGNSEVLSSLAYGVGCLSGLCNDRFDLVGTGLELIATSTIQISNVTGGWQGYYNIGEIEVNGTPAGVPEPGTLALLGLGLAGLGLSRRREA
jgi:hypothetical protein